MRCMIFLTTARRRTAFYLRDGIRLQQQQRKYAATFNTMKGGKARSRLRMLPAVSASAIEPSSSPTTPPATLSRLRLRDYQEDCIREVLTHVSKGTRRMGISLATGSGKTVIFTQLISRLQHPDAPARATQTLILAHRRELVQQALAHCQRHYGDATYIEVEMGAQHASGVADITIASVASIASARRIEKFDPARFKLILIDECHHAVSPSYLQVLGHFGVVDMDVGDPKGKPIVVGVSATLSRFDGLALGKVLDEVVYHKDFLAMIEDKWLAPLRFTTVQTGADLSTVRRGVAGELHLADLSAAVNTDLINDITVRAWMERAHGVRHSTIVFCVDIAHVSDLVTKFRAFGIDARAVTANTPNAERAQRLDAFRAQEFPVLINCGVFTEGTDIPNIDCVLLARPTRSRNLLVQMMGRGMRLFEGKKDCHVIDMVCAVKRGIVSVPTLLGLDPDEILKEESVADIEKRLEKKADGPRLGPTLDQQQEKEIKPTNVKYTDYETIFDLLSDTRRNSHIRQLSRLAWTVISLSPTKIILSLSINGWLTLVETSPPPSSPTSSPTFSVTETRKIPATTENPFMKAKPRVIVDSAPTLDAAVKGADTYASSKYPQILLAANAPWRKKPASVKQMEFIRKIRPDAAGDLTMGAAMDIMTRMKHGAQAEFRRLAAEKKREEKMREKERERDGREVVKVGKLRV